ncbi:HNH endonuclease [Candidatus Pacearchaeota archaeon]|nr:HNH endonuclease [Candidatus Pacearchaeota archaeon]
MTKTKTRVCTGCDEEFPATLEYFPWKNGKLREICKICYNKQMREYRAKNKDMMAATSKKYRDNNRKQVAAREKRWRQENKDKVVATGKKYRDKNKNKESARQKKWYAENKDKSNAKIKNRRAKIRLCKGRITAKEWANKIKEYDGKCAYCEVVLEEIIQFEYNPNGLTQDHVISLDKGGKHKISNVVPCCSYCNTRKNNKSGKEFKEFLSCQ